MFLNIHWKGIHLATLELFLNFYLTLDFSFNSCIPNQLIRPVFFIQLVDV